MVCACIGAAPSNLMSMLTLSPGCNLLLLAVHLEYDFSIPGIRQRLSVYFRLSCLYWLGVLPV